MIKKVFLIDDDDLSNYLTHFILEEAALADNIICYKDAQLALQDLAAWKTEDLPEVIFLDINMPYMSGWEFLEALRPFECILEKKTRIYILSSSINQQDINQSEAYKLVAGFLHKPLETDEVRRIKSDFGNAAD